MRQGAVHVEVGVENAVESGGSLEYLLDTTTNILSKVPSKVQRRYLSDICMREELDNVHVALRESYVYTYTCTTLYFRTFVLSYFVRGDFNLRVLYSTFGGNNLQYSTCTVQLYTKTEF